MWRRDTDLSLLHVETLQQAFFLRNIRITPVTEASAESHYTCLYVPGESIERRR